MITILCLLALLQHEDRRYWRVSIDSLAAGKVKHTHVEVHGRVALIKKEGDGDVHIRLVSTSGAFIVVECIPFLPCHPPRVGDSVVVLGIMRRDYEHGWFEVHPVEAIR